MKNINRDRKLRRKKRISGNIFGRREKPRISVFRSNYYIYAQAIDDEKRITIASFSSTKLAKKDSKEISKTEQARQTGIELGKILKEKGVNEAIFDRGTYAYHGRVKALADGLRKEIKI